MKSRYWQISIRALLVATAVVATSVTCYLSMLPPRDYTVVGIPTPNSGKYTSAEAARLLPGILKTAAGISASHDIRKNWTTDTLSFKVHVERDGTIRSTDLWGEEHTGPTAIDAALNTMFVDSAAVAVLLTAETDGWTTPKKQQVVNQLFKPGLLIYIVQETKQ